MRELIIVDGLAPDILTLIQDSRAPAICLGSASDPLQALTTALAGESLDVLHIVAHGHAGGFEIGGQWVDHTTLQRNAHLLTHWHVGRIALWVCELGQHREFAATLARLTGAEVFVSAERLGWNSDSGDRHWSLRGPRGQDRLDGTLLFGPSVTAAWNHQLVTLKLQGIYATTASGASDGFYGEETNSVTINTTPLSTSSVSFTQAGIQFSGNNVLGTVSYQSGGTTTTFQALASRPIKVGGVVKGFYVWLDNDHNNNGSTGDTAFVLSLDNSYFNSTSGIGSSSDRVDSSMNSVLPVNSAPTATNDAVTLAEDSTASGNVLTNDTDANGDALTITGFTIGGVAGSLSASNNIAGVGSFTLNASGAFSFTPLANYTGSVPVIRYTASDGNASSSASLTLTITPVNDAPTSSDTAVTTLEDAGKILSLANFGTYSDVENTPLAAIKITTLPAQGTLTLNGAAVSAGQSITASDISAGKLVYTPAANGNGNAYTTLKFQVGDGALFSGDYTLTVNVTPVNDAPAGSDTTLTVNEDSTKTFSAGDFGFTDPTDASANTLAAVVIASLPLAGTLALNNVAVTAGQSISAADIAGGKLTYAPAANANGNSYASFTFQVQDNGGTANGGTANGGKDLDPTANTITLNVTPVNDTPTAVNDAAQAVWSATPSYRSNPGGNVKTNDSDVDVGDTLTVTRGSKGGTLSGASTIGDPFTTTDTVTGNEARTYSTFTVSNLGNNVGTGASITVTGNGVPDGTYVSGFSKSGNTSTITLSSPSLITTSSALTITGVSGTVTPTTIDTNSISPTVIALSSPTGSLATGMNVTGSGITANTTLTGVTTGVAGGYTFVTLSSNYTGTLTAGTDLTFSGTVTHSGTTYVDVIGDHGTLRLNADGTYTYTVTDTGLNTTATDLFTYEIKDSSAATATATLSITIDIAAAAAPTAVADTIGVTEKGGTNNGTGTGQVSSSVLTNEGSHTGSISVVAATGAADAGYTSVTAGGVVVHGRYGDLSIKNDGAYTYMVSDSNGTVDALNASQQLNDVFNYRITDSGGNFATTTLTVTVQGANDAPVANNDVGWATEAGGTANGTAGQSAAGNVLANDTDVDNSSTKTVTAVHTGAAEGAGTAGTLGNGLSGAYGTLTLNATGGYTYVVNETAANALAAGATATDSFNYTVSDGSLTDTAVLTITVTGANDAPINTVPASQTLFSYETKAITGLSVTDPDDNLATTNTVALSVSHGSLSATANGAGTFSGAGTDTSPLLFSGTPAEVQAMLGSVVYTPTTGYSGSDTLRMVGTDALGLTDTDVVGITVNADDRALTVSGSAVNEASPFVLFTVGGTAGQLVTLSASGISATSGADFVNNLQYFDGSTWQAYSGTPVALPGATMLVRVPVLQDNAYESTESLQLTASNGAGNGTSNTSTIADDGSGDIFLESNTTGTPDTSGTGYPSTLDDDRALSIDNITVNEASSHAVFEVTGAAGQVITLDLVSGSATANADYTNGLKIWTGAGWASYSGSATIAAGGKLFVRVAITNDGTYEGPENFGLKATNGSGVGYTGTAIIVDDGTGLKYDGTLSGDNATTTTSGLDNDLAVSVSAAGPVSESSTYAMFTVTATIGENLSLALGGSGTSPATTSGFTLQYSYDGNTWTTYSASSQPTVPGTLGTGTGAVYVRANISSEQDNSYEGTETFTLTASTSTGAGKSASAETSITDDDTASLVLGAISAHTTEAGGTATFTVKLSSQPTATVTVATTSNDTTEGTVSPASLSFDTTNWNTPQTVTVSGVDDLLIDGDISYTVNLSATSSDTNYDGRTGSVSVTNDDNDVAGIPSLSYGPSTFTEALTNDGSISNPVTITLANDTFTGTNGAALSGVTVTNVPAGLTATVTRVNATEATLTLTGSATAHANANDISNLTVTFGNAAFTGNNAAAVTNAVKNNLVVDFADPAPALSYGASTFTEAVANDGSISNTVTITLANDTFTGTDGAALSGVTVTNVPAGLTATVTRVNATEATLTLTGSATAHANANDISNLTVTFGNAAFTGNNAAAVTNAVKNNLVVDFADPAPVPAPTPTPPPTPQPPVQPTPPFSADLDPASDTGVRDNVTMITAPDFTLNGGSYLSTGGSARLLDASGQVIGSSSVTAADIQAGTINVTTGQLDDGQYTFQAQVLNAAGQVVASAPVTVTVVTDRDGIKPSVELAANNGDYNQDGTPDWQQNNVAQLPLLSLADFQAGINAPASTFGAIIAGTVDSTHPSTPVKLDTGAQLLDLSISAIPAPLPDNTVAGSAMFNFSVTAQTGAALTDIAPDRAGLQTQVVIDLPTGITANAYMKYNAVTGAWTNFANPAALDGSQDGAALVDTVGDGKVHRIVITLTDGGAGDEDGTVNGVIVDPGLLAFIASPPPAAPPATPVYSVRLASGDRFYTTSVSEAATMAKGSANVFEGVRFDSLDSAQGGVHQVANHNPFTNDWYFAVDGGAMPYACYQQIKTLAGFSAAAAGKGPGEDFHLYLNGMGLTQLVTQAEAASLGLTSKGYMDRGAVFNTTTTSAFAFDAEAYLVANKNDATIQNLVKSLSGSYTSTSDGQFIEAVEQQYLTQVGLVGTAVVHGTTATAADLNAAFGTHFLA